MRKLLGADGFEGDKKGVNEGDSGTDEDEESDLDINAPVPDSDEDGGVLEYSKLSASQKEARLRELKKRGPTYKDLWGNSPPQSKKGGARGAVGFDSEQIDDNDGENDDEGMEEDEEKEEEEGEEEDEEGEEEDEEGEEEDEEGEEEDEDEEEEDEEGEEEDEEEEEDLDEAFRSQFNRDKSGDASDEEGMDAEDDFIDGGLGMSSGKDSSEEELSNEKGSKIKKRGSDEAEEDDVAISKQPTLHQLPPGRSKVAIQVAALEAEALAPKPWELRGEVGSKDRPLNSLLSAQLDVPQVAKLAPPVSLVTTVALEDLIRSRIASQSFDDPQRKVKGGVGSEDYRAAAAAAASAAEGGELSTEKSKLGLGDVYAEAYSGEILGNDAKASKHASLEAECKALWQRLAAQLDALANFHHTPATDSLRLGEETESGGEINGRTAAPRPALLLEEVIPGGVSDSVRAAPREIYAGGGRGRFGILKGEGEKSGEERAAERRGRKEKVRREKKAKDVEAWARGADANDGKKVSQEKLLKGIKGGVGKVQVGPGASLGMKRGREVEGGGSGTQYSGAASSAKDVGLASTSSTAHKSSAAFFAQLQGEAKGKIDQGRHEGKASSGSGGISSKRKGW